MTNNNEAIKSVTKLRRIASCAEWSDYNLMNKALDKLENKIIEALQPPKGYVLVPEEVTLDMYKAGQTVITQVYHSMQCEDVYKAMIQAGRKDDDR